MIEDLACPFTDLWIEEEVITMSRMGGASRNRLKKIDDNGRRRRRIILIVVIDVDTIITI